MKNRQEHLKKLHDCLEKIIKDINKPEPTSNVVVFPFSPRSHLVDPELFDLKCPHCGAPEVRPIDGELNIRAYKVEQHGYWYSFCLCCKTWF